MKEGFLQARGIAYRTNDLEPNRPTLLFVHGLSGSSSAWLPYERILERTHNIINPDLRGHGESRRPKKLRDYELAYFAEDIAALLEHLKVERCVIVSHSFGALVALMLLREHPKKFSKAVFLAPVYNNHRLFLSHLKQFLPALGACLALLLSLFRKSGGHIDYSNYTPTGDWNLRRIYADVSNTGARSYLFSLQHLYTFSNTVWQNIEPLPVLIVHGDKDSMVPLKNAVALSKLLPQAKLAIIKGANHILVLNNVPEVSQEIESFIK